MTVISRLLPRAVLALATLSVATLVFAQTTTKGALKIDHPWSRATVVGQTAGGAFMKIENTGTAPDRLVGASTPAAASVQLHTMAMDGDVMRMREVPAIDLPAGQAVELAPGRFHMMLVGLKAPLKADGKVPLTLKFEKAGEVQVELSVQPAIGVRAASHMAPDNHQH